MNPVLAVVGPVLLALGTLPRPQADNGADIGARIEAIRAEANVPALGAALVTVDGVERIWVSGTRRAGGEEKVAEGDRWHLGSCTKAMTATMIALLVARGDLAWDAALGDLLPDEAEHMHVDYLDVTLLELLSHRAGIPNAPNEKLRAELAALPELPLFQQRERVARAMLAAPPVHAPRTKLLYSNFGYIIAGHVAEVATKKPWETLMTELLFAPLAMTSAGFGPPGSANVCDQPRGHTDDGTPLEPGPDADNPPMIGPAGSVHASLADWAKFVQLHLRGERGDVNVGELTLTRDTFALLHRAYGDLEPRYALGWGVEKRDWAGGGGVALEHNGSNTFWYCVAWLAPADGFAVLVTANQANPAAKGATKAAAELLVAEHARGAKSGGR